MSRTFRRSAAPIPANLNPNRIKIKDSRSVPLNINITRDGQSKKAA